MFILLLKQLLTVILYYTSLVKYRIYNVLLTIVTWWITLLFKCTKKLDGGLRKKIQMKKKSQKYVIHADFHDKNLNF